MVGLCRKPTQLSSLPRRRLAAQAVRGVAPGDPAAAAAAAEVPRGADRRAQEVQEGAVRQAAHRQEGRPRVPGGGRRAAQACDGAAEHGAEAAGAGERAGRVGAVPAGETDSRDPDLGEPFPRRVPTWDGTWETQARPVWVSALLSAALAGSRVRAGAGTGSRSICSLGAGLSFRSLVAGDISDAGVEPFGGLFFTVCY